MLSRKKILNSFKSKLNKLDKNKLKVIARLDYKEKIKKLN